MVCCTPARPQQTSLHARSLPDSINPRPRSRLGRGRFILSEFGLSLCFCAAGNEWALGATPSLSRLFPGSDTSVVVGPWTKPNRTVCDECTRHPFMVVLRIIPNDSQSSGLDLHRALLTILLYQASRTNPNLVSSPPTPSQIRARIEGRDSSVATKLFPLQCVPHQKPKTKSTD